MPSAAKPEPSRRDYDAPATGPAANSLRPAVTVAVADDRGRVLLVRRADNGRWSLPGGVLEIGEDVAGCAIREVREETGLAVAVTGLVGVYSDPAQRIAYADGEVRQQFAVLVAARAGHTAVAVDDESIDWCWCAPREAARTLSMTTGQRRRLCDLADYWRDGQPRLG